MSRVYWHSRERTAELRGSERAYLDYVSQGPATAVWDLGGYSAFENALHIMEMVPEVPDGEYGANYLHTYMKAAVAQDERNKAYYSQRPGQSYVGQPDFEAEQTFLRALKTRLSGSGDVILEVGGHALSARTITLNTALVAGSRPIQLAARIHGHCEIHGYVEGPDRAWLAEVIDEGLDAGIYRRTLMYGSVPEAGIDAQLCSQGWEDVQALLRAADDDPVVMSYSVCDGFPEAATHLDWPGRPVESWQEYSDDEQRAVTEFQESWRELDAETQWDGGLAYLRQTRPWLRIGPDTLHLPRFGNSVTAYDLMAPDREERVARAFAARARQQILQGVPPLRRLLREN